MLLQFDFTIQYKISRYKYIISWLNGIFYTYDFINIWLPFTLTFDSNILHMYKYYSFDKSYETYITVINKYWNYIWFHVFEIIIFGHKNKNIF